MATKKDDSKKYGYTTAKRGPFVTKKKTSTPKKPSTYGAGFKTGVTISKASTNLDLFSKKTTKK